MKVVRRASSILLSCALLSSLGGCVLEGESQEPETIGESSEAITLSNIGTYPGIGGIDATNGKNIVMAGGTLHAVWASSGIVLYGSSTDGVTWTTPVAVDSNGAQNPTVGVASDGTVGVVYLRNTTGGLGTVYYARKPSGGSFQTPVKVTSNSDGDSSRTPSLVADGMTMHAAWIGGGIYVKYAAIPAAMTSSLASAENVYSASGNDRTLPALSVGPGPSGTRVVRVAFWDNSIPGFGSPGVLSFHVQERGASSWNYAFYIGQNYSSSAQAVSTSADINPSTGDAYIVYSSVVDGFSNSTIMRENAVVAGYDFNHTDLYAGSAPLLSIAARSVQCQSRFRVLASTPISGHGTITYRTGIWTGGWSPSWVEGAPVALPGAGRAGTALIESLSIPNTVTTRRFYGGYESPAGLGNYQFVDAYDSGKKLAPCE